MKVTVDGFVQSDASFDLANGRGIQCFFEEVWIDPERGRQKQRFKCKMWKDSPAWDQADLLNRKGNYLRLHGEIQFRRYKSVKDDCWKDDVSLIVQRVERLEYKREEHHGDGL